MARINSTQKYAVLWLNSQGWDIKKISDELGLTETQIKNTIKNNKQAKDDEVKDTPSSTVQKNQNSKKFMITESQSGKHNVAIMTKAASEINDENKKKDKSQTAKRNSSNIFKPYG